VRALRHVAAALLVLAGLVASGPAVIAWWVRADVLDTARFTAAVAPLSTDPAVRTRVADAAIRVLEANLGGPATADQPLPAVRRSVRQIVAGPDFPGIWTTTVAATHRETVAAWRAASAGGSGVPGGPAGSGSAGSGLSRTGPTALRVDLRPVVNAGLSRLVPGIGSIGSVPMLTMISVPLSPEQSRLLGAVRTADDAAGWLPAVAGALLALAVAVSPWWRATLVVIGLGVAAVGGLLLLASTSAPGLVAGQLAGSPAAVTLGRSVTETLTGPLTRFGQDIGLGGLALALVAGVWALLARRPRRDPGAPADS